MEHDNQPPAQKGLPRIRRELTRYVADLESTMRDLHNYRENPKASLSGPAAVALACAHLDRVFPPTENDDALARVIEAASQRQLSKDVNLAIVCVEDALAVAFAAKEGVRVMDCLGYTAPERWSNLEPSQYARDINRLAQGLCRGRIPGWSERQL